MNRSIPPIDSHPAAGSEPGAGATFRFAMADALAEVGT